MDSRTLQFLEDVLGPDGTRILARMSKENKAFGSAILPRAIVSWIEQNEGQLYKGALPGLDRSYLTFKKSEEGFEGVVSIGEKFYHFEKANVYNLAACVAVALGVNERVSPLIKCADIQRLGKSIDLMVGAWSEQAPFRAESLVKAIAQIRPGGAVPKKESTFDYSHVLSPEHRDNGYSLHVSHNASSGTVNATLRHGQITVGEAKGLHEGLNLNVEDAEIAEGHQGKGLGQHMYEGIMAHGFHKLGAKNMAGSIHSTMASRVHQKLSAKHGLDYKATKTPAPQLAAPEPGPYDARVGPYSYAIKQEIPMAKKAMGSGGAETPGPAAAPLEAIPPVDAQRADPTQNSRGPTVGIRPKLPKPPLPGVQGTAVGSGEKPRGLASAKKVANQPIKLPGTGAGSVTVTKSESATRCEACDGLQFANDIFTGCLCLRALGSSVKTTKIEKGYRLTFGADLDQEAIVTLFESLGK